MAKDIEKIIDDFVFPEMEIDSDPVHNDPKYGYAATVDDVPEVVLPKTKAEMYREAKGRLVQETTAASKTDNGKQSKKRNKLKTVELEIAAVSASAENADNTELLKLRLNSLRRPVDEPKWVGSADELVPFAWRNPLVPEIARPSKIYKKAVREARELLLPVPREK